MTAGACPLATSHLDQHQNLILLALALLADGLKELWPLTQLRAMRENCDATVVATHLTLQLSMIHFAPCLVSPTAELASGFAVSALEHEVQYYPSCRTSLPPRGFPWQHGVCALAPPRATLVTIQ